MKLISYFFFFFLSSGFVLDFVYDSSVLFDALLDAYRRVEVSPFGPGTSDSGGKVTGV